VRRRLAGVLSGPAGVALLSLGYLLLLSPVVPGFASPQNLGNVFSNFLPLLAVSLGQTLVLLTGGIDLSVTAVVALASVAGARVMTSDGGLLAGSTAAGVAVMLVVGLAVGLANGLAVARLRMPPFLATLAVMTFASGFAIWATGSRGIAGLPPAFRSLGGNVAGPVPLSLLVVLPLALAAHLVLRRTVAGRWLYAVGGNPAASRVSGVPVDRVLVLAYAACGLCAAIASVLYTARVETGSPVLGQRIFLDVIGGAVIGGTSLFGGRGTVPGTAFGVLFIALVDNSLNLLGLSTFAILMVKGGVILTAAVLDALRQKVLGR
jgi:ribose/xylose/arabinose/galactoside ABC-type transport system permease subunit